MDISGVYGNVAGKGVKCYILRHSKACQEVESCFVPLGNHQRKSQSSIISVHCEKLSLWWEKIRRQKLQPFSCEVMRDGLRQG